MIISRRFVSLHDILVPLLFALSLHLAMASTPISRQYKRLPALMLTQSPMFPIYRQLFLPRAAALSVDDEAAGGMEPNVSSMNVAIEEKRSEDEVDDIIRILDENFTTEESTTHRYTRPKHFRTGLPRQSRWLMTWWI